MEKMRDVLLCSTLHDERGVFQDVLLKTSAKVLKGYRGWVVNVTATTHLLVKNALRKLAPLGVFMTETYADNPIVPDKVKNDHLYLLTQTLVIARETGTTKIQYTDGDRIIMAADHFPQDLQKMSRRTSELLGSGGYVNFRRSPLDYFAHHPPLVQTELEFNRLYSKVFGLPIDIGSTAHGMSVEVVQEILLRSPSMERVSFPHPKWLLIAAGMGLKVQSEEINHVLTFETPYQFEKEVASSIKEARERLALPELPISSPYLKLQQNYMATIGHDSTLSEKEWELRFNTARQYLKLLRNHLGMFKFDAEYQETLRDEINRTLLSLEERQKVINKALNPY